MLVVHRRSVSTAPGRTAWNWFGIAGYGRYEFDDRHAFAIRAERFRDPDAGIIGFALTLTEDTMPVELRPRPHLMLKFEGRRDHPRRLSSITPETDPGHRQCNGLVLKQSLMWNVLSTLLTVVLLVASIACARAFRSAGILAGRGVGFQPARLGEDFRRQKG